ncbi:DNA primase family protein [Oceanobacillus kimchii]|uniref:DNA primase family protein n=1 Tax=Oceanobacillus kimchii TaxID=746691 RepID=UPI003B01BC18
MEELRINPFGGWDYNREPISTEVVKELYPQQYKEKLEEYMKHNSKSDLKGILTDEDYSEYINELDGVEFLKQETMKNIYNNKPDSKRDIELSNFFHEKTNKFVPARLGKVINKYMHTFFDGNTLYYYKDGVYIPEGDSRIKKVVQDILGDESNSNRKREVIDWLKTNNNITYKNNKVNPEDGWINVKNGLLNLETRELIQHTHKRLSTIQLPITYNPHANDPIIHKFISSVVHKESIDLMYEMAGYLLTSHTKAQKAFIFHSGGGSGKSVIVTMLQAFIGKGNYSTVAAQDIDGDRFSAIQLKGKTLNIVDDLKGQRFSDTGKFKSSVTGGEIAVEEKGKPQEIIKPIAKHIFCMNNIPESNDMSEAWRDRWIMIPLPNRFRDAGNEDKQLPEKIVSDSALSTLLNHALKGLDKLRENNYRFSENEHTEKLKNNHFSESDPLTLFMDEFCQFGDNLHIIGNDLYKAYTAYCEDGNYKPVTKIKFNKQVRSKYKLSNPNDNRPREYNRLPTWKGVSLI